MKLSIKYFGLLTDITHCYEDHIAFSGKTIGDLREQLYGRYPGLAHVEFQIAQDLRIISDNNLVTSTEIAFLPPFAGG